jgi:hypothetical protein
MADLYTRLEELQGMTRLLIDDLTLLRPLVGLGNPDPTPEEKTYRRFYARAVFALVEAFAEQHRRLLLDLCGIGAIILPEKKFQKLAEIRQVFKKDGTVEEEEQYLQIFDKIKAVYKGAGTGFGERLHITFGNRNWEIFREAMAVRNRVTHPKRASDCWIFEVDLQKLVHAHDWFRSIQNEFVRVARAHRNNHHW